MTKLPNTQASLLVRLRDPADAEAWREFVQVYAPVIHAYARRRQCQDADAADLTQEVLRSVASAVKLLAYDRRRGTFRGWLFTITRHKLLDFQERQRRGQGVGGTSAQARIDELPARAEADLWEEELQRHTFAVAAEKARAEFEPATWEAFWQTAVEDRKPAEVAATLGVSVGAVYIARSRVQARLKQFVIDMIDE
jgi:RNA polymerase sigma-70 factor (ECF subfamily)